MLLPVRRHIFRHRCYLGLNSLRNSWALGNSPIGATDMSGNVWEWSLNEYRALVTNRFDLEAARSLRGGSFSRSKDDARVNARNYDDPAFTYGSFGFRVCAAPKENLNDE